MKIRVMICVAVLALATLLLVACGTSGGKTPPASATVQYPADTGNRIVTASAPLLTAATTVATEASTSPSTQGTTASVPATARTTAISVVTVSPATDSYVSGAITPEQLAQGGLILVNKDNPYLDGDLPNRLVSLYENKTARYQLAGDSLKLEQEAFHALDRMLLQLQVDLRRTDVLVRTAFRASAEQKSLYEAGVAEYGDEVLHYTMPAGCSDYQTGLAVYLQTISDDPYELDNLYSQDVLGWLTSYAAHYGFVQRYPAASVASTGIYEGVDDYHYRYVGIPHALLMADRGMCLEEYVLYLQDFRYGENHLQLHFSDGSAYEIYYVPYVDGMTEIPVPAEGTEYTVSGTNAGGFVVTVTR